MSITDLERRLGEVLRQHAEDAMSSTDTHREYETLEREIAGHRPRTRVAWVAAAAVAAAAVAALVVVDASRDDRTGTPAAPVDHDAAVALAADFMDALAAYDADRAASYLAEDARVELKISTLDAGSASRLMRWARSAGITLLPGRCALESGSATAANVTCVFGAHGLGSEQLGRGPFEDNVLRLTVVDDEIVSGTEPDSDGAKDFEVAIWEPFTAWLLSSDHADEWGFMYADWPGAIQPALTERSARLWEKNVDRYVAAVERGDTP